MAAGLVVVAASGAGAQPAPDEPGAAPAVPRNHGLVTGVSFEAEVIDVRGRPVGNGTELVGRAVPSLTLVNRGGRLRGTLIYSGTLTSRRGVNDREGTDYANSLSANYLLEAIEGVGFVDARAVISQQLISAIGGPTAALQGSSRNRSEVTTVSLSPYLRGRLGGAAEFEVRATDVETKGGDDAISNSSVQQGSFFLRSPPSGAVLGWSLAGSHQRVKFSSASAPTDTDRVTAEIVVRPDIDWRFSVSAGQESTDVVGALRQSYDNYGVGLQWTPSPRTTVSLQGEQRYFGRAYRVQVDHRFMRSSLRLSSVRDVNIGSDSLSQGQVVTLYELYFIQFASQIPDPVQRDQFVLALLQALGRNRNEVVSGGLFGNTGVSAQRRHDVVWTWAGQRLTTSVSAYAFDTERVDQGGVNPLGRNDNAAQSGYAASVGWRLTPLTSINATGSRSMSKDTVTLQGTDLKSVSLGLNTQFGARTGGTLGARYSVFNGVTDSYRETALTGSLSLRF